MMIPPNYQFLVVVAWLITMLVHAFRLRRLPALRHSWMSTFALLVTRGALSGALMVIATGISHRAFGMTSDHGVFAVVVALLLSSALSIPLGDELYRSPDSWKGGI